MRGTNAKQPLFGPRATQSSVLARVFRTTAGGKTAAFGEIAATNNGAIEPSKVFGISWCPEGGLDKQLQALNEVAQALLSDSPPILVVVFSSGSLRVSTVHLIYVIDCL
jgi:hypothetical protein